MRNRLLFVFALVLIANSSFAQIVGTNVFLQGAYLEIGEEGNGSFGANSSPTTYHSHTYVGSPAGGALAEVYDYGHDGWTVGTPPYMGDYTYPGTPFEGWEIQMNGTRAQQYQATGTTSSYSGAGAIASLGITSYSNTGGDSKKRLDRNLYFRRQCS